MSRLAAQRRASRLLRSLGLALLVAISAQPSVARVAHAQPTDSRTEQAAGPHESRLAIRWQARNVPPPAVEAVAPEAVPAGKTAQGLTVADLEAMALANHPGLRLASARVQGARGRYVQGGLPPNPTFGYVGAEIGDQGQAGQQGAFFGQQFITGGKLQWNRAVADREVERLEQEFAAQQQRVVNDVRIAFYDVLAAQRSLRLAEQLVEVGHQGVATVEALLRAQEASEVDLLQAQIEADSAAIALANATNRHRAAWQSLSAVVAVPELMPQPLSGSLEVGLPDLTFAGTLERLLSSSPQLASAWIEVERAHLALHRARAEPIPNVNVQGSVQYDDSSHDAIAGLQIGMPLPVVNLNQGGIREAAARVSEARAAALQLELALQQQLAAQFERYANARQQVERYRNSILPNAEKSLDKVLGAYRQGEFPYLTLLTAQRTYFSTNLAYVQSLRELRSSAVAIDGLLLQGSLQNDR